ncbi:lipase/acyltransferase domain-containing protein [Cardinium endosymbiont of Nabis limbatus]|uniref:alpha/beta hydrolase n=1 Tax=Cardinium endosymbiont of Nabis limbatus TaxID=3066217 RepID=UPI003AF36154
MFPFNTIAIYLTILLSIIGCECRRLSEMPLIHEKSDSGPPLIVLFHGLGSDAACFSMLKQRLERSFPDVDVIALSSVKENNNTFLLSIKEQASQCFQDLLKETDNLRNRPTLLIGHSQGGLRAYKMLDLYRNELNIKGIITLATPWEGAPALNLNDAWVSGLLEHPEFIEEMKAFSRALGKHDDTYLENKIKSTLESFKSGDGTPGFDDLKPESEFLARVKAALSSESIPILAIGGAQSDFRVFLSKKRNNNFKLLRNIWTQFIMANTDHLKNDENKRHDMVVPLYSQLASNCVSEQNKNFERYTIDDAIHDEILELPYNKKSRNILAHPDMFKTVEEFAKKVLGKCQPNNSVDAA